MQLDGGKLQLLPDDGSRYFTKLVSSESSWWEGEMDDDLVSSPPPPLWSIISCSSTRIFVVESLGDIVIDLIEYRNDKKIMKKCLTSWELAMNSQHYQNWKNRSNFDENQMNKI